MKVMEAEMISTFKARYMDSLVFDSKHLSVLIIYSMILLILRQLIEIV